MFQANYEREFFRTLLIFEMIASDTSAWTRVLIDRYTVSPIVVG